MDIMICLFWFWLLGFRYLEHCFRKRFRFLMIRFLFFFFLCIASATVLQWLNSLLFVLLVLCCKKKTQCKFMPCLASIVKIADGLHFSSFLSTLPAARGLYLDHPDYAFITTYLERTSVLLRMQTSRQTNKYNLFAWAFDATTPPLASPSACTSARV